MTVMPPEAAAALRKPFPAAAVGKLPKITCRACSNSPSRNCNEHQKSRCEQCGNWITVRHTHLDYVGHAEVTDRLLQVDPLWSWEPVAFTSDGLPAFDQHGSLWIRLTIAGVTRLGYGSADGKKGADAIKEIIGDAIRNAAMRFGVGIDLWGASGVDLETDSPTATAAPAAAAPQRQTPAPGRGDQAGEVKSIGTIAKEGVDALASADTVERVRDLVARIAASRAKGINVSGLLASHAGWRDALGVGAKDSITLADLAALVLAHWEDRGQPSGAAVDAAFQKVAEQAVRDDKKMMREIVGN